MLVDEVTDRELKNIQRAPLGKVSLQKLDFR